MGSTSLMKRRKLVRAAIATTYCQVTTHRMPQTSRALAMRHLMEAPLTGRQAQTSKHGHLGAQNAGVKTRAQSPNSANLRRQWQCKVDPLVEQQVHTRLP